MTDVHRAQATPADRKVVLMRLLARAEAERLGIVPSEQELRDMARWFRVTNGLGDFTGFAEWLAFSGLDLPAFTGIMRDFVLLARVLEHHRDQVDQELPRHLSMHSVRQFSRAPSP